MKSGQSIPVNFPGQQRRQRKIHEKSPNTEFHVHASGAIDDAMHKCLARFYYFRKQE